MKSQVIVFALLTAIVGSVPALAQNGTLTRSFVSSAGVDTNPCTITQPCGTFAQAYTKVGANGIVAALDPGKYGPLTIAGPVTINGNGWSAITGPAQGDGITVNAVSGNVTLTGLEIDGASAAYNGIVFNSGSSLTVTNCVLQNFVGTGIGSTTGNGVLIQPTSGAVSFDITNTAFSNNGNVGIDYIAASGSATANGAIDHIVAINNNVGIQIYTVSTGSTKVAISNSVVNNNSSDGIYAANSTNALTVSIDNSSTNDNGSTGIDADGTPNVTLGRSVITGNGSYGVVNGTTPNTFYSYQDNRINGNGTGPTDDVNGSMMISDALK
jgi:hypothetical protein